LQPAPLGISIAMGGVGGTLGTLLSGRLVRLFGLGRALIGSAESGYGSRRSRVMVIEGWGRQRGLIRQ
jgi:hypothetical protein